MIKMLDSSVNPDLYFLYKLFSLVQSDLNFASHSNIPIRISTFNKEWKLLKYIKLQMNKKLSTPFFKNITQHSVRFFVKFKIQFAGRAFSNNIS